MATSVDPGATEPTFGPQGELMESTRAVCGLPLPRGVKELPSPPGTYAFHSPATVEKLQAYVASRVLAGAADAAGSGVVYRGALARAPKGPAKRCDVSLLPSSQGGVRIEFLETPPAPARPLTQPELERRFRHDLRTLD